MYELSLTSVVEERDFKAACAVLGGFCAMAPWITLDRVLYYTGPPRPVGITNQASIDKPMRKDAAFLWKDLHQSLSRQSYVIEARYEILKDRDMGPKAEARDLDATQGILRWADFPEPPHGRPLLTQRKIVEIWDQKKIPSIMRDNNFRFKSEMVQETYRFFRDGVEFRLSRQYFTRRSSSYERSNPAGNEQLNPLGKLPAWTSMRPADVQKRWILSVKNHVLHDNKPDEIRKAQDELLQIRGELEGVFAFKVIDRKVQNLRIAQQRQGVQALPQKVTLEKN